MSAALFAFALSGVLLATLSAVAFASPNLEEKKTQEEKRYFLVPNENNEISSAAVDYYNYSSRYSALETNASTCPLWSYLDNTDLRCRCPDFPLDLAIECDDSGGISVLNGYCLTYDANKGVLDVGACDYNYVDHNLRDNVAYYSLPFNVSKWNEAMCGDLNRDGTLCGRCQEGSYPRAYSFDMSCMQGCDNTFKFLKYVAAAFLPLTLFYFAVVFFKINIHFSHIRGYVFYSQAISIPVLLRILYRNTQDRPAVFQLLRIVGSIYGIWNLDFFRLYNPGACLSGNTLVMLSLDLIVGIYPLVLMGVTYITISLYDRNFWPLVIAWKPFKVCFTFYRRNWDIRTSTIDSFSTFFFLSNVKIISTCFDLVKFIRVYSFPAPVTENVTVNVSWRHYYEPSTGYFESSYDLLYLAVGYSGIFMFFLLPSCLLIFYPLRFFQKCVNVLPRRGQICLRIFVDSIQGCYKDGTEAGTRDYRCFSALFFIIRFVPFVINALFSAYFPLASLFLVVMAIIIIFVNPFKEHLSHLSDGLAVSILFLAGFYTSLAGLDLAKSKNHNDTISIYYFYSFALLFGVMPNLYIFIVILKWIVSNKAVYLEFVRYVKAWKRGYSMDLMQ